MKDFKVRVEPKTIHIADVDAVVGLGLGGPSQD